MKQYLLDRLKEWSTRVSLGVVIALPFFELSPTWNGTVILITIIVAGVPDAAVLNRLRSL